MSADWWQGVNWLKVVDSHWLDTLCVNLATQVNERFQQLEFSAFWIMVLSEQGIHCSKINKLLVFGAKAMA